MNGPIDLMPRACRQALGRRARIRRWLVAYIGTGSLLLSAWLWVGNDQNSVLSERSRLVLEVERRWSQDEEVQHLIAEIQDVESAVTRYNSLAWPIRISEVLDAVGAAVPTSVTMKSIMATPRTEQKRRTRNTTEFVQRSHLVIELEGIAIGDRDVALLVKGFEKNPLFDRVTLDYTKGTIVDGIEGRSFRVTAEIDLLKQYTFIDSTTDRGLAGAGGGEGGP